MQSSLEIITPATSFALMKLEDLKIALRVSGTTEDPFLTGVLDRASAEVGAYCMRVFAKEKVVETFTDIPSDQTRLWLRRWPVIADDIESVVVDGVTLTDADYELDEPSGKLTSIDGWDEPVVVTFTGGYALPDEAPLALQQATLLLSREAYYAAQRGDSNVRMISHKESRVIYFDPNAANRAGQVSSGGSAAQRAAHDLLTHFTRYVA